ncbi:hypothetical protein NOS3756_47080 [Nostoc sp. NIES-3756]|uniref:cyanoexosortase A n=1 Tax=Nostoc sp. NIES-3756 TaxID=1751286 RepID=UPI0007209254|nr:cyanoexosortase A [Nostoc sp. NIES-3756]BAT55715.1 hypothetical protein NOS3756_47080 [Nostoc sp. NIES-3756]
MKYLNTKHHQINIFNKIKNNQFWLLSIASGLITIHLTLTSREVIGLFAWSIIFWVATSFLVWKKRHTLNLESSLYSSIVGFTLITIILLRSLTYPSLIFLGIAPFVIALALSLIASGFAGIKQYKQELILLFFFNVPHILLLPVFDISAFTAKFATYILWYLGFEATVQGFSVVLPQGSVLVYTPCAGLDGILDLIRLSVLFFILFPLEGITKKVIVTIASVVIAFVTNSTRVALMAVLTAAQNQSVFDYWHDGKGSLIFSVISTALLGIFYYFLLLREIAVAKMPTQETIDG